ncbi:DMT family transporter [Marinoscillum sp. MHG1-6]|uniref:DMT family transporter n=1 Tax=Marinoscillum sp. MHG1-6 TaxID=2959627 RepID=UPI0021589FDA|nr:DMT family transporter [Marinoscillum sp. MHG1-6]
MSERIPLKAWILLILLALIWGSSFILIKRGLLGLTPMELGALRIFSAGLILAPVALRKFRRVEKRHYKSLIGVALVGSLVPSFLFAIAQTNLQSGVAGVLNSITPIFTMLIGIIFFQQRINTNIVIGALIGFAGTSLLILAGSESTLGDLNVYALLVVLASMMYGMNGNLIKFNLSEVHPLSIASLSLTIGGFIAGLYLLFFTDFFGSSWTTDIGLMAIGYTVLLGVIGTALALVIFNRLVHLTNPVFSASVTYLIPIVALLWGIADQEIVTWVHVGGVTMILFGVYISTPKRRHKKSQNADSGL